MSARQQFLVVLGPASSHLTGSGGNCHRVVPVLFDRPPGCRGRARARAGMSGPRNQDLTPGGRHHLPRHTLPDGFTSYVPCIVGYAGPMAQRGGSSSHPRLPGACVRGCPLRSIFRRYCRSAQATGRRVWSHDAEVSACGIWLLLWLADEEVLNAEDGAYDRDVAVKLHLS